MVYWTQVINRETGKVIVRRHDNEITVGSLNFNLNCLNAFFAPCEYALITEAEYKAFLQREDGHEFAYLNTF